MKTTFLDTQFVVALVNERDENHLIAEKLSYRFENKPLLTTEPVLFEIGNSLARSFRQPAVETIRALRNRSEVEIVPVSQGMFLEALAFYERHSDKTWGLVDCLSFVVMRKRRIREALTNDQHFEQAGFVALMNVDSES